MGIVQRDLETRVSDKAEELAQERYCTDFSQLSSPLQMRVWMDAEHEVTENMTGELEAARDKVREEGGDHWGELELQRRLGK